MYVHIEKFIFFNNFGFLAAFGVIHDPLFFELWGIPEQVMTLKVCILTPIFYIWLIRGHPWPLTLKPSATPALIQWWLTQACNAQSVFRFFMCAMVSLFLYVSGFGNFRKKYVSSRKNGRNWKKDVSSSFFRKKLEESGRNTCSQMWTQTKCWK